MCLGEVAAVNSLAEGSYTLHGISFLPNKGNKNRKFSKHSSNS